VVPGPLSGSASSVDTCGVGPGRMNGVIDALPAIDEPLGPDQYLVVSTHAWAMKSHNFLRGRSGTPTVRYLLLEELRSDRWVPAEPSRDWVGEQRRTGRRWWLLGSEKDARADGIDLDHQDHAGRVRAPYGDFLAERENRRPGPRPGSWRAPSPDFLAALPRDPDQLLARLEIDHPRTRFSHPLTHVAGALRSCLFPADLRAAFYRGLLQLPGISVDEHTVDLDGRPCVALAWDIGARIHELLIDPATGQYAGERDTAGNEPPWPIAPGTVVRSSATLTAITDGPGELPEHLAEHTRDGLPT
jgi:hypothetical protein